MPTIDTKAHKLGKRAPRLDRRTIKLEKYLVPPLVAPPRMGYIEKVPVWTMGLNDRLGTCVPAACAHTIQQTTTYGSGKPFTPSDADILTMYEKVGGYVNGDPSTDNGTVILDALKYWRNTGIGGHRIIGFASVDPKNRTHMDLAMYLFGSVIIGVMLPWSARNPTQQTPASHWCWSVPKTGLDGDGSPGSWGGHCVTLVGYNAQDSFQGSELITWAKIYDITPKFVDAYADEAWVVLTTDLLNAKGKTPAGRTLQQMAADIAMIQ